MSQSSVPKIPVVYKDYLDAIVRYYQVKKGKGSVSPRLLHPTPGKLKQECLAVFKERFDRKDFLVLKDFFGVCRDNIILKDLHGTDRDKFKPLVNFLNRGDRCHFR